MTITHSGTEWLAQLAGQGRWLRLLREAKALVGAGRSTWPGAAVTSVGPWLPMPLWRALCRASARFGGDLSRYSAILAEARDGADVDRRARSGGTSLPFRPGRDPWETRVSVLRRIDPGNYHKGAVGGWKLDVRDPTADRRLVEFCLSVPPEQYLSNGQPATLAARAFGDRLPAAVLAGRGRGLQAADWHEALTADRDNLRREVERFAEVPAPAGLLDVPRMTALLDDWPSGGWHDDKVTAAYRILLLRGASIGHFLRKASSTNA